MRLAQLDQVQRIVEVRAKQLTYVDALVDGLVITIDSNRMDDAMLALCRPVIERELRARARSLEHDLVAMGVSID